MAIVVLASLYLVLTRSWLGRAIRASAVNPQGAELVGVNVASVAALTFAIGVASAGAGRRDRQRALSVPARLALPVDRPPARDHRPGRMGSLPGAVIGALCLGVAELMTVTYIGPEWATGVPYVFVFVVLLLRPQGILGTRLRQDVATA